MKCPVCGIDGLLKAQVTIQITAPLVKGGGVNLSGIAVTQDVVKETWAKSPKYPINCTGCGADFHYDSTSSPALRKGAPASLRQLGFPAEDLEPKDPYVDENGDIPEPE